MKFQCIAVLAAIGLTGCGGGGSSTTTPQPIPDPVGNEPPPTALLVPAGSDEDFNGFVIDSLQVWGGLTEDSAAIESRLAASPFPQGTDAAVTVEAEAASDSLAAADTAFGTNTGTNVIVADVDELDAAKFNGEYLFLANNQHLTVLQASADGGTELISNTQLLNDDYAGFNGLYLYEEGDERLLAAVRGGGFFSIAAETSLFAPWSVSNSSRVDVISADDVTSPRVAGYVEVDGNLMQSRRIGNTLYLVSQYSPYIENYQPFARDEEARLANEAAIAEADPSTFVPMVSIDGAPGQPLVDPASCLLPNTELVESPGGYPTLTTVAAIDLTTRAVAGGTCMVDTVWGIHMTTDALYVASPSMDRADADAFYETTTIHKFSLADAAIDYRGSGSVDGSFWGDPTFLMGEHEGNLTVITTQSDEERGLVHRLSILGESADQQLEQLGSIPNENRPEFIGKPNEQIFAARILRDRAYVVTFERIDPVYAIDLSDATDPVIVGELEIPGFSSYLHPVSDSLLLGVGSNTSESDGRVTTEGLNVRLFDVGSGEVSLLGEASIGDRGSYSALLWDYHAFTFSQVADDRWRFAIPVNRYEGPENADPFDFRGFGWTDTSLHLFEIVGDSLSSVGLVTAEDRATGERYYAGCCSWQDRSFFSGDSILYLSKNLITGTTWSDLATTSQTFIPTTWQVDPAQCGDFKREPLSVSLFDSNTNEHLSCGYSVAIEPEPVPETDPESEGETGGESEGSGDELESPPELIACEEPVIETDRDIAEAGSYTVTVSLTGYQAKTVNDVQIQADACGLSTTYINLYLDAE